jgi:hypothetical protein
MPIDDFVRDRGEDGTSWHPLLRFLEGRIKAGDTATFELHQPTEVFGYRKAKIYIHLSRAGEEHEYDCKVEDWDDDLNAGLVRLGVKAVSVEAEKDRFALGLRAALRKPEKRYGDGYFGSVLVEFIQESDFHDHPEVAEVLKHVPHVRPNHGQAYPDCRDMIEEAIRGRGLELTKSLKYPVEEATQVLAGALARYLDDRFSVSSRRVLGLL